MTNSKDILNNPDEELVAILSQIDEKATALKIPFFLIGATARDIYFSNIYGIPPRRLTFDVDFGIQVKDWDQYNALTNALIHSGFFRRDETLAHRFHHSSSRLIDFLPFGEIERLSGLVVWPFEDGAALTTIGFEEALSSSVEIQFRADPFLLIRVATPIGLTLMKLIAWDQDIENRSDYAKDLRFFMEEYFNAGGAAGLDELVKRAPAGFDPELAGPWLLGREVARLAGTQARGEVARILERETRVGSQYRLGQQMIAGGFDPREDLSSALNLLRGLTSGFMEQLGRERQI